MQRCILASAVIILLLAVIWWPKSSSQSSAVTTEPTSTEAKASAPTLPYLAEQIGEATWRDVARPPVEDSERTWTDEARDRGELDDDTPEAVKALAWRSLVNAFGPDVTRLKRYPGVDEWMPIEPEIDVDEVDLAEIAYVTAVPREVDQFDHRIAIWKHRGSDQVAAVVEIWAKDGLAAAQSKTPYPIGAGPLPAPLSLESAAQVASRDGCAILTADRIVTWGVPAERWMYRFGTDRGVRYVSQDPVRVWTSLEDWRRFAEERDSALP